MTSSAARLATGAVALSFVALGATPALAVCDPYSQACVAPQDDSVRQEPTGGGSQAGPTSRSTGPSTTPSTLPFTGGEVVLMAVAGAAAVGGGAVLVAVGRRRTSTAA